MQQKIGRYNKTIIDFLYALYVSFRKFWLAALSLHEKEYFLMITIENCNEFTTVFSLFLFLHFILVSIYRYNVQEMQIIFIEKTSDDTFHL